MRADCADENKSKSQTADTGGKKEHLCGLDICEIHSDAINKIFN